MRLVTNAGVCDEVGENIYAANDMTRLITTPGISGGEKHQYVKLARAFIRILNVADSSNLSFDLIFPIGARLVEYMHETGVHQFPKDHTQKSPLQYACGMTLWQLFDKYPGRRKCFDDYMAVRRAGLATWYETFPMAERLCGGAKKDADAVLLVDVGGNWGHELAAFHQAHPDVPGRLVLQDLPGMIDKVKKENPPKDVECLAYDLFTSQPIKGARAYYFRSICHDWPDEDCEKFLTNTARVMEKGYSRLLIDEYVLPDTGAPMRGAAMDLLMMMLCSGIERTRHQWESLLNKCGLEIIKIWGARADYEQVIEAQLKT